MSSINPIIEPDDGITEEDVSKLTETSQSSVSKWTGLSSFLTPQSWQLNRCSDTACVHMEEEVEIEYSSVNMNNHSSPWKLFHTQKQNSNSRLATVQSDTSSSTVPSDEEDEDTEDTDFFRAYITSLEQFLATSNKHRRTISAKDSRRQAPKRTAASRAARVNALGQIQEGTPEEDIGEIYYENQSSYFVNSDITGDSLLAGLSLCTADASIETVDVTNTDKKMRIMGMHKTPQRQVQVLVPKSTPTSPMPYDESMAGTASTQRDDSTNPVANTSRQVASPPRKKASDPPKQQLKTLEESSTKKKKDQPNNPGRSLFRKCVLLLLLIVIAAIVASYTIKESNSTSRSRAAANRGTSDGGNGADANDGSSATDGGTKGDATGDDTPGSSPSDSNGGDSGDNIWNINGGNNEGDNNGDNGGNGNAGNGGVAPVPPTPIPTEQVAPPKNNRKTPEPTPFPTLPPTPWPTNPPINQPTPPSNNGPPALQPTTAPTPVPPGMTVTYVPGKLSVMQNGLRLSQGLKSKIIAQTGDKVKFPGNKDIKGARDESQEPFHVRPDGAEVFADPVTGGWAYVSNSEAKDAGKGGVGAIYFDANGDVVDYQMLLQDTTWNCAGGKTPWDTWVSCEEVRGGSIYQVDPFGRRAPQETTMGKERGGFYEAFAYDIRDTQQPRFFATEDHHRGTLRRFTPTNPDWNDPWTMLHGDGVLEYMHMTPNDDTNSTGTFQWTTDFEMARNNAFLYFQNSEGLDVSGNQLYAVCKYYKELFIFNLDDFTYTVHSTQSGIFDGMPDQMKRLVHDEDELLYICEEGGSENGVHARNSRGWFFTIFESAQINDETTGLAFSPDKKHMYAAFQETGLVFDVWREDGLPFNGRTLNVKYHETFQSG